MQTNTNKTRTYRNEGDKLPREDRKRDKYSTKEQRKRSRNAKLSNRDIGIDSN